MWLRECGSGSISWVVKFFCGVFILLVFGLVFLGVRELGIVRSWGKFLGDEWFLVFNVVESLRKVFIEFRYWVVFEIEEL